MEIFINNHAIDFQLENESTVSKVIESLMDWTKERDLIFSEVIIDGECFAVDEVPEMSVDDTSQINCLIESRADIVISSIDAGIRYCEKAKTFIDDVTGRLGDAEEELKHLGDGLQWLSDVLLSVVKLIGADPETALYMDEPLARFIENANSLGEYIVSSDNLEQVLERLDSEKQIFTYIREIFRLLLSCDEMRTLIAKSIDSPDTLLSSLLEIKNAIPAEIENLKKAAIAFQGGNDADGVESLNRFIGFIYAYTRSCYQVVPVFSLDPGEIKGEGESSLEEKNLQLQDLLSEIEEVMENDDIISLSDILEYELVPVMQELDGLMGKLLEHLEVENS